MHCVIKKNNVESIKFTFSVKLCNKHRSPNKRLANKMIPKLLALGFPLSCFTVYQKMCPGSFIHWAHFIWVRNDELKYNEFLRIKEEALKEEVLT